MALRILNINAVATRVINRIVRNLIPSEQNFTYRLGEIAELSRKIRADLQSPSKNGDPFETGRNLEALFEKREELLRDYSPYRQYLIRWLGEAATQQENDFDYRFQAIACMSILRATTSLCYLDVCKQDPDEKIRTAASNAMKEIESRIERRNRMFEEIISGKK